ncbi:MAG: ABC transporter ATP-binding protein [Planctomycetes bacterium]|nr:ABC transporter ATP-binding protein [Planctomycetota bacterium]
MSEAPIVLSQGLTKLFKDFWLRDRARAVDGINFEVRRGEVFGLLGPNGSGKSTTIKMILGLLRKTSGRLAVFGKSPQDVSIKKRIGYLPEESYLYPFLNARETLDYYAKLFQLDGAVRRRRIDELLDMVGLSNVQHRQVREYSKGMQRRIGIAQALINDPELLILDEPTTGLDPIGNRQVKDLIDMLGRRGKTIILSSHLLSDVEDCVDRLVILYGGKIRAEGTCDSLLESREKVVLETDALDPQTIGEINGVLERHARSHARVSRPRQRLEDLFIGLVEKAQSDRVATSGAQHGGRTASFLEGEAGGAALIENLVEANQQPAMPADRPREAMKPAGPDQSLLSSLSAATKPAAPAPENTGAVEPDQSVIGSLLDGAGPDKPKSDGATENRGR